MFAFIYFIGFVKAAQLQVDTWNSCELSAFQYSWILKTKNIWKGHLQRKPWIKVLKIKCSTNFILQTNKEKETGGGIHVVSHPSQMLLQARFIGKQRKLNGVFEVVES